MKHLDRAHILTRIVEAKQKRLQVSRTRVPEAIVRRMAETAKPVPSFQEALLNGPRVRIIAEVKKASPSKGVLRASLDPSDLAVALAILDAVVHVQDSTGRRSIPIDQFFALPGDTPEVDNTMRPGELILGIELPPSEFFDHSWYLKVRDRHSYAFALVSVAAGLRIDDGVIASAALALGGVAATPWRLSAAEASLVGKRPTAEAFDTAAQLAMAGARPLAQNEFKVDLGRHSVVRALTLAAVDRGSGT